MTGGVELNPDPALKAAQDLQRIAQEVTQLLAEMRPDLQAPPALSVGDKTAEDILAWYRPNAENLGQVMDVVASNADALGQDAQQTIQAHQGTDEQAAAQLRKLARQSPGAARSPDLRA